MATISLSFRAAAGESLSGRAPYQEAIGGGPDYPYARHSPVRLRATAVQARVMP